MWKCENGENFRLGLLFWNFESWIYPAHLLMLKLYMICVGFWDVTNNAGICEGGTVRVGRDFLCQPRFLFPTSYLNRISHEVHSKQTFKGHWLNSIFFLSISGENKVKILKSTSYTQLTFTSFWIWFSSFLRPKNNINIRKLLGKYVWVCRKWGLSGYDFFMSSSKKNALMNIFEAVEKKWLNSEKIKSHQETFHAFESEKKATT